MAKSIEDFLPKATPVLKIVFPDTNLTTAGQKVSKPDSKPAPTLFLKSPTIGTYMAMSLDPDAPFPSFSVLGPILHSLELGLSPEGDPDEEGWVKLSSSMEPLVPWLPPSPPSISKPHRYVFLVWKQPEGLTAEEIKRKMKWGEAVGVASRMRWKQSDFEKDFGLGPCVAGSWFLCG